MIQLRNEIEVKTITGLGVLNSGNFSISVFCN